jgi:tetratricopeptide (TPR) repeat protein
MPAPRPTPPDAARAAQLRALGATSLRAADPARARKHFERALALCRAALGPDHPETLGALSDLGAACAALSDHAAARAAHEAALAGRRRTLGDAHPDTAASLHNLGATCSTLGDLATAATHHEAALAIWRQTLGESHPLVARSLTSLALLALDRGDPQAATQRARQALTATRHALPPNDPALAQPLDILATAQSRAGDHEAAAQAWQAAIAVLHAAPARAAPLLLKHGIALRRLRNHDAAAASFAAALRASPGLTAARHHLAATLTRLGRTAEARPHRDLALRQQPVFIQPGAPGSPRVLIPALADDGNIPLDHLLPEAEYTRIWWFIAHGPAGAPAGAATPPQAHAPGQTRPHRHPPSPAQAAALPPYDIVFNAIADPDRSGPADAPLAAFLASSQAPALNDPARIAATRRDRLPALLAGIANLVIPPTIRLGTAPGSQAAPIPPPYLLRPAGAHGGAGLQRIAGAQPPATSPPAPAAAPAHASASGPASGPASDWYITPYHELRAPDGHFRKYRMIFIDREIYPYHLAISQNWLVHYVSADMPAHAWKLAEEAAFLANPAAALGHRAHAALAEAARRIDLDYCGIDFTMLPDGQVFVFEANATMLVHPEDESGPLAFKNGAVQDITAALRRLIDRKMKDRGRCAIPPEPPVIM